MGDFDLKREQIRAALLGIKPKRVALKFSIAGEDLDVEVEAPTIAVREEFMRRIAEGNRSQGAVYLITACTFIAGTQERVFKPEDTEALLHLSGDESEPYMDIARAAVAFITEGAVAARKKSAPTPSNASSTT